MTSFTLRPCSHSVNAKNTALDQSPCLCGLSLGLTLTVPVWADIRIPRTTVAIEIDGELNESSWQQARSDRAAL